MDFNQIDPSTMISCSPDRRPTVLAFATRPIKAGDEICDCYSGVFGIADKEERSAVHARYHFQVIRVLKILFYTQ
jgi:hypothetical protein